jgi:hypothetical protein
MDEQLMNDPTTPQEPVDTVDLELPAGEPPPKGVWAGRIAIALLAVVLVAGGIAIAQDDDEPTESGTSDPLALALGTNREAAGDAAMAPYPYGTIEYRLEGTLPDLGAEAPVYRLVQTELTADDLARMAAAVGISAPPQQADGGWTVDDGTGSLWAYPAAGSWSVGYGGSVTISEGSTPSSGGGSDGQTEPDVAPPPDVAVEELPPDDPDAPVSSDAEDDTTTIEDPPVTHTVPLDEPVEPVALPTQDEAEQIATDLLDEMGVTADAEWTVTVGPGSMMGYAVACAPEGECDDAPITETQLTWSVSFQRVVDGVTTSGLDWVVEVGDEGAVPSVYGTIADVQPMGDYPLRTTQTAFGQLQNGEGIYPGPVPMGAPEAMSSAEVYESNTAETVVDDGERVPSGPVNTDDIQCVTDPCPGFDTPETAVTTMACLDQDGNVTDCALVDPVPTCGPNQRCANPEPPVDCPADSPECAITETTVYEPEPIIIVVTGAELRATVTWATEDGVEVQYLVPTYHFVGHHADGTEWSTDLIAVADSMLTEPEVPDTTVDTAVPPPVETIVPDCTDETPEGCEGSVPTTWMEEPVTTVPPTTIPTVVTTSPAPTTSAYPTTTANVSPPPD